MFLVWICTDLIGWKGIIITIINVSCNKLGYILLIRVYEGANVCKELSLIIVTSVGNCKLSVLNIAISYIVPSARCLLLSAVRWTWRGHVFVPSAGKLWPSGWSLTSVCIRLRFLLLHTSNYWKKKGNNTINNYKLYVISCYLGVVLLLA